MSEPTGSYVLLLDVRPTTRQVGALGEVTLDGGFYTYLGSARGPGGLARVDRHHAVARGDREVRHWHIDYLLGATETDLVGAIRIPGLDVECRLACQLGAEVHNFGASDCTCPSHLAHLGSAGSLSEGVREVTQAVIDVAGERAYDRNGSEGRGQS